MKPTLIAALRGLIVCGLLLPAGCAESDEVQPRVGITIGEQVWMPANLSVNAFRNGDLIPRIRTKEEWFRAAEQGTPAWCYYEDDPSLDGKYGKLYNYFAVVDPRGLAPAGWRIANDQDWNELADFLGGPSVAGQKLKAVDGWKFRNHGGNQSGFTALPGGYCGASYMGTNFRDIESLAAWWIYPGPTDLEPEIRFVNNKSEGLYSSSEFGGKGYSVRCLKDVN